MAWPTQIITDAALLKYIFEQGVSRILESGDYTALYQGVSIEMRSWLETHRVSDADDITNTADYEQAAAHLAFSKIIQGRGNLESAKVYFAAYTRLMQGIRPAISSSSTQQLQGSPVIAPGITKQGSLHYTPRLSRHVNPPYRK